MDVAAVCSGFERTGKSFPAIAIAFIVVRTRVENPCTSVPQVAAIGPRRRRGEGGAQGQRQGGKPRVAAGFHRSLHAVSPDNRPEMAGFGRAIGKSGWRLTLAGLVLATKTPLPCG